MSQSGLTGSVVIIGAGINGACIARDLALNGVPVCVVDAADVAGGATSRSSRLIHGGLRYLEYRDVQLVEESLRERNRLMQLAPQFVSPLRLMIPVRRITGGLWSGLLRFLKLGGAWPWRSLMPDKQSPRGLLAIRFGLWMYDRLARSHQLPRHRLHRCEARESLPPADPGRFRWLCEYSDARVELTERFVTATLADGQSAAARSGNSFDVHTWSMVQTGDPSNVLTIQHHDGGTTSVAAVTIINATGAWGDRTLAQLGHCGSRLFAGTKGSHLFSMSTALRESLRGYGIYCEADDGRLVFILPCAGGCLIGTTDEPFPDDPGNATATEAEIDYLIEQVNTVFPAVNLTRSQVMLHHAGVRPLPNVQATSTAAIPRGHSISRTSINGLPVLTLIGGKLTTCRQLAEEAADEIFKILGRTRTVSTRDRAWPGHPDARGQTNDAFRKVRRTIWSPEQTRAVVRLVGHRVDEILDDLQIPQPVEPSCPNGHEQSIPGTSIPISFARWSLRHEWCLRLEDLVERRLMLIFEPGLNRSTLEVLTDLMIDEGLLPLADRQREIEDVIQRLSRIQGRIIS